MAPNVMFLMETKNEDEYINKNYRASALLITSRLHLMALVAACLSF